MQQKNDVSKKYSINETIARLRKASNLTQEDVASRCDINRNYLSRIEKGHVSPTFETVEKIMSGMGFSMDFLTDSSDLDRFQATHNLIESKPRDKRLESIEQIWEGLDSSEQKFALDMFKKLKSMRHDMGGGEEEQRAA